MCHVFIIDDDPIQHSIASILMKKYSEGTKYESFINAGKALDELAEHVNDPVELPDVILLDLNMPAIDGWKFLKFYEELVPRLKKAINIFVISSSVDQRDISRAEGYSFVKGFYSKPLTPDFIVRNIENHCCSHFIGAA